MSLFRLRAEWCVEAVSGRQGIGDLREGNSDSPIYCRLDQSPNESSRSGMGSVRIRSSPDLVELSHHELCIEKRFGPLADMLNGEFHSYENPDRPFSPGTVETDDPLDWAVYGRRICGWDHGDLPLRYSSPPDVCEIVEALQDVTPEQMWENLKRVAEQYPYGRPKWSTGYKPGEAKEWHDYLMPHALPNLRNFFEEAQRESEFVVHHLG